MMRNKKVQTRPLAIVTFALAICLGAGLCFGGTGVAEERSLADRAIAAEQKSETVTVATQADGAVEEVRDAVTLANPDKQDVLLDVSDLADPVSSDQNATFEREGNRVYWKTSGEDVSYQGTADEADLPFSIEVTYQLDDKSIDPDKLAGKSGHIAIRYDYRNLTAVDGKPPIPLVALTALVLDDDVFANVETTNARVIDMGDTTMVAGYAAPGLQEYLDIDGLGDARDENGAGNDSDGDFAIPEYVEIEADVTEFKLDSSLTVVSSDLLDGEAIEFDTSDLDDSMTALSDGMDQLVSGSQELSGGAGQLSEGAAALATGAGDAATGAEALAQAIGMYADGVAQASTGAAQLYDGLTAQAQEYGAAGEQATAAVTEAQTAYEAALAAVADGPGQPTEDEIAALKTAVDQLKKAAAAQASARGASQALAGAAESAKPLSDGLASLDASSGQIKVGASNLSSGLGTLSDSTEALASGASQVASGTSQLSSGISQYNEQGIQELVGYYENDLLGLRDRLHNLTQAGKDYDTFSGLAEGTEGSVRFLFEVAAIGME